MSHALLSKYKISKKASDAENQQERLIDIGWIVGFVDGEGCFSINFIRQSDRVETNRIRKGYKTGFQVEYEFAVTQGESSLESLKSLKNYFGVGGLYVNKRYDNHKEHLYRYCVRKLDDLVNIIIPFFEKHPLRTSKNKSFEMFVRCIDEILKGNHLTREGLEKIMIWTESMNHRKSKSKLIKILRNQTSDSRKERR